MDDGTGLIETQVSSLWAQSPPAPQGGPMEISLNVHALVLDGQEWFTPSVSTDFGVTWHAYHPWEPGVTTEIAAKLVADNLVETRCLDVSAFGDPRLKDEHLLPAKQAWDDDRILCVRADPVLDIHSVDVLVVPEETLNETNLTEALRRFFTTT